VGLWRRLIQRREPGEEYPRQFWLLFWGLLISATGGSMVWPFLTIYVRERFDVPLRTVTLLLTLNSVAGLLTSMVAGLLVDRFGRRGAMMLSLFGSGMVFAAMSAADTLGTWALVMIASGAFSPLYRVGSNAMVADLIEPERRAGAYALLRLIANVGVAIGPSVGGFLTTVSYDLTFYAAAVAHISFATLVLLFIRETAPQEVGAREPSGEGGYREVLRDRPFLTFCGIYTLAGMAYSTFMVLLPVYIKEHFGVPESRYGFIMATNAGMVVLLQYGVTRITERYPHLSVLAIGSLFYALGVGSVALGRGFPAFLASMVVLTVGEMIMMPTSTTLTANLAPPTMRGRYMSVYGLTWGVALAVGPVLGGLLGDWLAPVAIWYGGMALALGATGGFLLLARRMRRRERGLPSSE